MERSLMKPKLLWNLQYQAQNSFQERSFGAFERESHHNFTLAKIS